VLGLSGDDVFLVIDGEQMRFARGSSVEAYAAAGEAQTVYVGNAGWSCRLEVLTRESRLARVLAAIQREEGAADPEVRSPMPGTVVSVAVNNGDTVAAGQVLLSVEAMKMEHQLVAEVAGTVHTSVKAGDLVKADQVLATIHHSSHEPPEGA
jgi:acetyl-CoA/propionyl-CoA carboxylase biotin carboxyl carrier protein